MPTLTPRIELSSPDPLLILFPDVPSSDDPNALLLKSLEVPQTPAVCAAVGSRPGTAAPGGARWVGEDSRLRWQSVKGLLDQNRFRAVGFVGAAVFRDLAERVAEHARILQFVYLSSVDESLRDQDRWRRGWRNLRMLLLPDSRSRKRFESLFPGPHPFHVQSLDGRHPWTRRLDLPAAPAASRLSSIITPVYNRVSYTQGCIRSVLANTPGRFEWIIIDNGSSDGTGKVLAALARVDSRVRVIRNQANLGFARAVNQGLRRARGQSLVLLNNDTVVSPGWLDRLNAWLDFDPGLGAVGPCTNQAADVGQHRNVSYEPNKFDIFATAWSLGHEGRMRPIHRLIGFCLALRRQAYEQVGPVDERFGIGGYEDYDYCLRLRQAGWRLGLAEDVFIHHFGHVSFGDNTNWRKVIGANREIFLDKWTRKSLEFLDDISDLRLTAA